MDLEGTAQGFAGAMAPIVGVIVRRQERAVWEGMKHYLEGRERESAHDAAG